MPYRRDSRLARPWAAAGTPGQEHRVGGLEKEAETGTVSYDPSNHERMVRVRAEKIAGIAADIPELSDDQCLACLARAVETPDSARLDEVAALIGRLAVAIE